MIITKKLLLLVIPVVVLLIAAFILLLVWPSANSSQLYLEKLDLAKKSLDSGDYEKAELYYLEAIKEDDMQESAYLELADLYYTKFNDLNKAIDILNNGYEKIKSEHLKLTLQIFLDEQAGLSDSNKTSQSPPGKINVSLMKIISSYTYKNYKSTYTLKNEEKQSGTYKVSYSQLDAIFTYTNENNSININTGLPNDFSKPSLVTFNDLSSLISGIDKGFKATEFKSYGALNYKESFDKSLNKHIVTFTCESCKVTLACDENGCVKGNDTYNEIIPPIGNENSKVRVFGNIVSVLDGKLVGNGTISIFKGSTVTGDSIQTGQITNGSYSVELEQGEYVFVVDVTGFNKEKFNVIVSAANADQEENFSLSPSLENGKIRIVLEWGDMPRDLDSHLDGITNSGESISISFQNKQAVSSDGSTIAELDIDDTDGEGPETITLNNSDGEFQYKVHRYSSDGSIQSSGAIVKVYTGSSSQPIVIRVPSDQSGEWWNVFSIKKGQILDINGITQ